MNEKDTLSLTPRFIAVQDRARMTGNCFNSFSSPVVKGVDITDISTGKKTVETVTEFVLSLVTAMNRGVNGRVALKAFSLFIHTHTATRII
jgi:hypothetical protein